MKAPFPWFGGKARVASWVWEALGDVDNYVEWMGQAQCLGWRPVRLVALLVLHRVRLLAATKPAIARSLNASRWMARCSRFETRSRLSRLSLSVFSKQPVSSLIPSMMGINYVGGKP